MVMRTKEAIGNSNQVLGFFARCKELQELHAGKRSMLDNYGQILAQTPKGQLRTLKGVTRSEYIRRMSGQADSSDALRRAEARVKELVPGYQSYENLGVLEADANGLYAGTLTTMVDHLGKPRQVVGIIGMTLVKELSVSINLYQTYTTTPEIRGLLSLQKSAMAAFVRVNN